MPFRTEMEKLINSRFNVILFIGCDRVDSWSSLYSCTIHCAFSSYRIESFWTSHCSWRLWFKLILSHYIEQYNMANTGCQIQYYPVTIRETFLDYHSKPTISDLLQGLLMSPWQLLQMLPSTLLSTKQSELSTYLPFPVDVCSSTLLLNASVFCFWRRNAAYKMTGYVLFCLTVLSASVYQCQCKTCLMFSPSPNIACNAIDSVFLQFVGEAVCGSPSTCLDIVVSLVDGVLWFLVVAMYVFSQWRQSCFIYWYSN